MAKYLRPAACKSARRVVKLLICLISRIKICATALCHTSVYIATIKSTAQESNKCVYCAVMSRTLYCHAVFIGIVDLFQWGAIFQYVERIGLNKYILGLTILVKKLHFGMSNFKKKKKKKKKCLFNHKKLVNER